MIALYYHTGGLREWNIQDDMEISPASVSLCSLSAMRALVPRSSTPPISMALGLRTHNSLTKAHPHGQGHAHSGMPQWQMELAERERERCPDLIQYTGLMQAVPWSLDVNEKQQMCSPAFFVAYEWGFGGYRWKRNLSLRLTSVPQGCEEVPCGWLLLKMASTASFLMPYCNALQASISQSSLPPVDATRCYPKFNRRYDIWTH